MKILSLVLSILLAASTAVATPQHGRGNKNHGKQNQQHEQKGSKSGDRDRRPNRSGRENHGRIHDRDTRWGHGRRDFRWGGVWFTCFFYPSWFWAGEVYVVDINGEWFVVSYNDPRLMQLVVIID